MDIKVIPKLNLPAELNWPQARRIKFNWPKINPSQLVWLLLCLIFIALLVFGGWRLFNVRTKVVVRERIVKVNQTKQPAVVNQVETNEEELEPDWISYQAPEPLNLNFAYPKKWHILINTNYKNTVSAYAKATIVLSDQPIVLANKVQDYPIILEISNQTLTYKERLFDMRSFKKQKLTIDGVPVTAFEGVNPTTGLKEKAVVFYFDKKVYVVMSILDLRGQDYNQIVEKLLASLKISK